MATLHRLLTLLLVVVLLSASMPRAAWAQTAPAEPAAAGADDDKRRGDEAMIALRYEEALGHYRRAYEATKNPALLYNMGRAYEGLGEFPKALDALEQFTEKASPELKARVPKLGDLVTDVRNRVATMIVSAPVAQAEIRVGDKVVGATRQGQTVVRVNAGPQTLTVTHKDYFPFSRQVTLAPSKIETVDVVLASRTAEALLRVTSPVSGAAVVVDGKAIGNVPAEVAMQPGQHAIALRRDGYDPAETSVVLAAGEKKDVNVPMAIHETITSKWWFWTSIGVVLVAGGIALYVAATTEKDPSAGTIAPGTVKAEGWGIRF
ncbi:MAG: hypothetical protein JWP87_5591 [Labilithrix sp.]|nr:hypothetical protein [Labilithrix sp.]